MNIDVRDVCAGALVAAIGLFFLIGSLSYDIGDSQQMGPGYFPFVLGGGTVLMGLAIALPALRRRVDAAPLSFGNLRPLVAILLGVAAFGAGLSYLGLVPAVLASVAISALGHQPVRLLPTAILAVCTAAASWLVFIMGLGLPLVAFKGF